MVIKNARSSFFRLFPAGALALVFAVLMSFASAVRAADRADVDRFLKITGFDIALETIALGALNAPEMLGQDPGDFGDKWRSTVEEVMKPAEIVELGAMMLEKTLEQELLDHGLAFYGSDFGMMVVAAENAAHQDPDDATRDEAGQAIVSALVRAGAEGRNRLDYLRRMNAAVDSEGMALRAIEEIQIRFLMAAAAHGVIALRMDEADMREMFRRQEAQNRAALLASGLANAAYTDQSLSDDELRRYTEALEAPKMKELYTLMKAIQYEITAMKFETLASRMADLRPSQEL